ncbi:MAG: hypothetical protein P9M14_02165 [Candidatus Alcyoniella australis]|nr:hypothetical protein [Candidatus Alcyoniella australis]
MKKLLLPFLFICFALSGALADEDGIELHGSLDREQTPLNRTVNYTLSVSWSGSGNDYLIDPPDLPELENLALVGSSSRATRGMRGQRQFQLLETTFELRPVALGTATVKPLTVHYLSAADEQHGSLSTTELSLTVVDPLPEGLLSRFGVRLGAFAVGLLLVAGLLLGLRRLLLSRADQTPPSEQADEIDRDLAQRFEHAALMIRRGEPGPFAQALSELIRHWARVEYNVATTRGSSVELVIELQAAGLEPGRAELIKGLLADCDQARFGSGFTMQQAQRAAQLARPLFCKDQLPGPQPAPDPDAWLAGRNKT